MHLGAIFILCASAQFYARQFSSLAMTIFLDPVAQVTDASQGPVLCRPTGNVRHIFKRGWDIICGPAQDRPLRSADLAGE